MVSTEIPSHQDVRLESADTVWDGRFPLQVVRFRHRRFDGTMSGVRTWELWRRGRAAAVLPYDPVTDKVVMIEQFRLPALAAGIEPVMVELCAGLANGDESPEDIATREAQEEMGLTVTRFERIGGFLLTPGGCDEYLVILAGLIQLPDLAPDGRLGVHGLASEQEDIAVRAIPAAAAIEDALAGRIPNSVASLGLLWLAARRDWLRKRWSSA
jgi:ADP-ribose pyrophosphatase